MLISGFSLSGTVLVAQYIGAKQNEEASKKIIAPRGHTIWFINLVQSSAQRDQNMSNKPLLEA